MKYKHKYTFVCRNQKKKKKINENTPAKWFKTTTTTEIKQSKLKKRHEKLLERMWTKFSSFFIFLCTFWRTELNKILCLIDQNIYKKTEKKKEKKRP